MILIKRTKRTTMVQDLPSSGGYNFYYHRYMVEFMGFVNGAQCTMDKRFEEEELFAAQPHDITQWMRAYLIGGDGVGGSNVD